MKVEEVASKLIQPRYHRAKVSIWSDLTIDDLDALDMVLRPDQVKMELARIFGLEDYTENLKNAVLIDLYFYTIQFARDNTFSKEQMSTFFSIVKKTHEVCTETPFGNVQQCFAYFREMVLCHAVKRPPYSIDLFQAEDVRKITEYVVNTYFRHFKLYKYVFTPLVRLDLSMKYPGMPAPTEEVEGNEKAGEHGEGEGTSEEGNVEGDQSGATQDAADNQETGEGKPEAEGQEQEAGPEESAAAKELRSIIRDHLNKELQRLKISIDEQIKESEETINKRLQEEETASNAGGKGPRASARGKKK